MYYFVSKLPNQTYASYIELCTQDLVAILITLPLILMSVTFTTLISVTVASLRIEVTSH